MTAATEEPSAAGVAQLDPDTRAALIMHALGDATEVAHLLSTPEGRRALSALHPLVFALTYLPKHITGNDGKITFADMHVDISHIAATEWTKPNSMKGSRHAVIAPRECGKSTWAYLVLPLWAAAHGYSQFIAAFSDTAGQAHRHLNSFKRELESNELIRSDYPALCSPLRRPGGVTVSDRQDEYAASNGFRFVAMGIDGPASGLKDGAKRPDLLLLDDIEGGAGTYTAYEAQKRLETLRNTIFYLNLAARVMITGTTTLNGGIIHQLQQQKEPWVTSENINVEYYPALYANGTRSTWPAKWSVEWLKEERRLNPREFARNMLNQPVPTDAAYWTDTDFTRGDLTVTSRRVIAVDPAVTTARSSDETGVAVVGFSTAERRACVDAVHGVRMKGEPLRRLVLDMIARYPLVTEIVVERNQGGETLVEAVFHDMPVPVRTVHNTEKKELRFERLLSRYRRGQVLHSASGIGVEDLEQQMLEVPKGLHDDRVDAVTIAIDHLAGYGVKKTKLRSAVR